MRTARMACGVWAVGTVAGLGLALSLGAAMGTGQPAGSDGMLASGAAIAPKSVRYGRDVRPLLSDRCFKCHGPDAAARKAGLRLDEFESATADMGGYQVIAPEDVEASELWARIVSDEADVVMPPPESGKKALTADERELLRRWIAEGAEYEPHWSFVPPSRPTPPTVRNGAWVQNDIDRFVLARLEAEGTEPAPEADRATLARRVFMDLTGLPPTPEETDAFVGDAAPGAYERLVDRLLGEEPYRTRTAERLTTPWLDAARYADTCGIHTDNGRQMWAWRDWVLAAYRDNMPFDRFVTEQIAGDLLPGATLAQKVASGFNRNHVTTDEGGAIAEEYLVEYAVDRASTTASVFLGLTMGCARCHDHKYDPISQEDFYRFFAFFNSIEEPGLYTQTPDANRAHEPFIEVPTAEQATAIAELSKGVEEIRRQQAVTSPEEERAYGEFMTSFARDSGVRWAATEVVRASAESAAELRRLDDGSVLVSGANPPTDVHEYTLSAPDGGEHRVLLVEALEHESLGSGRVGRAANGNAVLTAIEIESWTAEGGGPPRRHAVRWLWADVSQTDGDYHFTNLLLENRGSERGWAVNAHNRAGPRHLLVLLDEPVRTGAGGEVRVRLRYESSYAQHVFGRVRLTLGSAGDLGRLPVASSHAWVVGPFPTAGEPDLFVAVHGPEGVTRIDFSQNFGAGNQSWRYDAGLRDGVPVSLAAGTNTTYIGRLIVSPRAQAMPVSLGSDDGFALYVNGREVARRKIERGVAADQDRAVIPLEAGPNVVVLKIVNTSGDAGYYFKATPPNESYPPELAAALLPERCRDEAMQGRIRQAWRVSHSPEYLARQDRVEELEGQVAAIRSKVAKTMVMKELDTPRETFVLNRGVYDAPDKSRPVTRGVPIALGNLSEGSPSNRLGLAQWLVSKDNPLTARVAVNRVWEMLFGNGLVKTSEDFGLQGEWPSHPELLDYLACEYRDGGWDTRALLRLIVTSATYRQSSKFRPDLTERDPENRLLARYPSRRQSAEQVRDHALYVSGLLVERAGGPSAKPYQPEGLWREGALPASNTQVYEPDQGEGLYRRTLYTYWKRALPPPSLQVFDAPTREFCVVKRPVTSTPLQALVLWNDPQFVEAARALGERCMAGVEDDTGKLSRLFRRCTGRDPDAEETSLLVRGLEAERSRYRAAPEDAARLLAVGMRPLPDGCDQRELAAWTLMAGAVMNLYQTTTQQ